MTNQVHVLSVAQQHAGAKGLEARLWIKHGGIGQRFLVRCGA